MKSKGGARKQPAPAPAATPPPPTSPTGGKGGAKYRNRDGSKFITLPDSTSAPSSAQPSPTIPDDANAKSQTSASAPTTEEGPLPTVNRKKQKRREKAAVKAAAAASVNGSSTHASSAGHDPTQDPEDSEEDDDYDGRQQHSSHGLTNGHALEHDGGKSKRSKKKKKKGSAPSIDGHPDQAAGSLTQPPHGSGISRERIWLTDAQEERERIKEFWLGLGEDERKSLVRVEKASVLQKMKEQQNHHCSCSVCGRKRNAIEEELEGLYDAYYEELEQFANNTQDGHPPMLNPSRHFGFPNNSRFRNYASHQPSRGRIVEHVGDDEEEELDEPYSEEELEDAEAFSDDEPEQEAPFEHAADFFNFGSSLEVKGGILTVADDLLKNDGKRFIDMMEQLAERRMAREGDLAPDPYARTYGHSVNGGLPVHEHSTPPPVVDEEYEDEEGEGEGEDEDGDYEDSQEGEYDDDDQVSMTDEQRMEEGRRMFQIFAARMFEQRVLHAYREKVAKERQLKLVEEEEEEERKKEAQKLKKAREAQRKKEKAAQKKATAAEEKARKEAEKAAEEEAQRQAEAEKAEEARRKAEEKRKKKEMQKKAEDDERARKEAEKQRQRQLQLDQERKVKEAKEREKKALAEKMRLEKEAREQQQREASELKEKQEAEKRQKELASAKVESKQSQKQKLPEERAVKKTATATPAAKALAMRPAQPAANPALPALHQQPLATATNFASPKPAVATPALPKAPTPMRPRKPSHQDAVSSAPTTTSVSENTSLSHSPAGNTPIPSSPGQSASASHRGSIASHHSANVSQTMSPMQPNMARYPPTTQPSQLNVPLGGMNFPPAPHHAPPPGLVGPAFPPVPPGYRPSPGMPPPGLNSPMLSRGFPVHVPPPPGFPHPSPDPIGPFSARGSYDLMPGTHSRQPSGGGYESPMLHAALPVVRPTPIGRPASVVPGRPPIAIPSATGTKAGDDMENHLGSSALLDDSDDVVPLPEFGSAPRRGYAAPGRQQGFPSLPFGDPGMLQQSQPQWGTSPIQTSVMNSFVQPQAVPPGFGGPAGWPMTSPVPGFSTPMSRPMPSRQPVSVVRQKLCNICRDMALQDPSREFIPVHVVLDALKDNIEFNPLGNGPLTERDVLILCETEGTMVNGGGIFDIVEDGNGRSIRWKEHKVPQSVGAFGAPGQFGSPGSGSPFAR